MPSLTHRSRLFALAALLAGIALTPAGAASARSGGPAGQRPASVATLRLLVRHERSLTWTFERAAYLRRTPSSFSDRRSTDPGYLRWLVERWTGRAARARAAALRRLRARYGIGLPHPPGLRAPLARRVAFSRVLTLRLSGVVHRRVTRAFANARAGSPSETLRLWEARSARAVLRASRRPRPHPVVPAWLAGALTCIHRYEGAWTSNTGNGYYGGLQMDLRFQSHYGREYLARFGTADRWPVWAQLEVAARAYHDVGGFYAWPYTARACGLL